MVAFIGSVGMTETFEASHLHDGGELRAAVTAGVARLLTALVELVAASVGAVGMIGAGGGGELTDVAK